MDKIEIEVEKYLSEKEIAGIIKDRLTDHIRELIKNEENLQRLLSNHAYEFVHSEIDKVIPNYKELIKEKVQQLLQEEKYSYHVFRSREYGGRPSIAYTYIEETVKENKELMQNKIIETIKNEDYKEVIAKNFENLAENLCEWVYNISDAIKKNS